MTLHFFRRQKGFSLIELMVTVALVSILMAVATPSFLTYQRNSELTSLTNSLSASLNAARGEAMKRGMYAMVTPIDGTNWGSGWFVFVDTDRTKAYNSGTDILIATSDVPSMSISINPNGTASESPPYIMYDASGYTKTKAGGFGALTFSISRNDVDASQANAQTRRLVIASTGRLRVCKPATDSNCSSAETQ